MMIMLKMWAEDDEVAVSPCIRLRHTDVARELLTKETYGRCANFSKKSIAT